MNWLKGLSSAVWIGILGFLAAMALAAAKRQKDIADQWKDRALDIELGNVVKGTQTAQAASSQAEIYDNRADEIVEKAEKRVSQMGGVNEDISVILDRWRS